VVRLSVTVDLVKLKLIKKLSTDSTKPGRDPRFRHYLYRVSHHIKDSGWGKGGQYSTFALGAIS